MLSDSKQLPTWSPSARHPYVYTCAVIWVAFLIGSVSQADDAAEKLKYFENHVRPLLHTKCVKCHGENKQEGGLRLDSAESILTGGDSGPAAITGKPGESLLMEAVRYESFEMPPDKPLSAEQVNTLQHWIAEGMAWPRQNGKSVRLQGAAFTDEELNFWSLQPLSPSMPPVAGGGWAINEIDRFIAAAQEQKSLTPAPRASETVLLRRVFLNLLGVPPDSNELSELEALAVTENWPVLVDRLLSDPRFGEHWARHWLDLVRYAESDGFRADFYRPDAWRYRDYVINSFNDDKPYDQFVTEQLAGDEVSPDRAESIIATGYLRTYLYEYNQRDARTQWQDILNQVTDVTGEVFLGMSVGCARCHDHKFDPILQQDYFRLQAAFGTMIPRDDIPAADSDDRLRYQQEFEAWKSKESVLRQQLRNLKQPYMDKAAAGAIKRFPEDIQVIMSRDAADRNPLEAQLADLVNRQVLFDQDRQKISEAHQKEIEALEEQLAELAGKPPAPLPTAITVTDVGRDPQPVHLGGNPQRKSVGAGGFTILGAEEFALQPLPRSTGQRTALAQWITDPANPLTARVIVNRIWQQHFGTGLVTTASDFGSLGQPPSHPELLDWLAAELISNNWSLKWLHRKILTSATWQMSAFHPEVARHVSADPTNQFRWRFDIRRLNAEQIRDTMLTVSGELLSERGGPSAGHDSLRRSIYLKALRNTPEPLMSSLDGVDGLNSVPKRSTTTTPTQALNLMNGKWVRARSDAMAGRILDEFSKAGREKLIEQIFRTALGRSASDEETKQALLFLAEASELPETKSSTPANHDFADLTGSAAYFGEKSAGPLRTADASPPIAAPFSFIGMLRIDSLYEDASVRTIISQWDSNTKTHGWSIGVTSQKSRYQPRNFIIQVISDKGYEVVASNLRPELGKSYLAAVTIQPVDSDSDHKAKAVFYLQEVDTSAKEQLKKHELLSAEVEFGSAANLTGNFPVVIGGRTERAKARPNHRWDGLLDQIAIYDQAIDREAIQSLFAAQMSTRSVVESGPIAFWDFEGTNSHDDSKQFELSAANARRTDPLFDAVSELCHVLMNSNEFVYVD